MIPDVSEALSWLEKHPEAVQGIGRGIERETLRVQPDGQLSLQGHPETLGSALTHDWIITDFAESLLEFVTPVDRDIKHLLAFLRDIHRYVTRSLGDERLWPFSMPCIINDPEDITLAQYGSSNIGRMKTVYREGLKHRYGSLMQVISGLHYNFSLPEAFWQARLGIDTLAEAKDEISAGYLQLIRNYYRFGWIIPYLFGASPAICESFLPQGKGELPLESNDKGTSWLPYATSLRLSDLGYTNKSQSALGITFNTLEGYVAALKKAIKTPSEEYAKIGVTDSEGKRIQLNTNVLQIENELYAPIRPKRVIRAGEAPSAALSRGGIEYIEVRSLDVNPFTPIGINEEQIRFLDMFLIWCALADAPEMSVDELQCTRGNWNRVVMEGRKPGLKLSAGCGEQIYSLQEAGHQMFAGLQRIARVLDAPNGDEAYQQVCRRLLESIDDPAKTYSAKILQDMQQQGLAAAGTQLAEKYRQMLMQEPLEVLTEEEFRRQAQESFAAQAKTEAADTLSFEDYLAGREG
ncbi:glutamate--cysteine ligase [Tatumella citrea]|uniref:Glutamate--cysteine ligase n=1 Tax=Tatumella citrea TaxID=53336 RepID=A0A1Y0LGL7_TATCI|nr:glutamate--cysteine ligase [Tatumella citrea]ARU93192.1 glutamate--cysteine ligase [Tatumella citrea]ARU97231.1 glutamate--cysteine ligase [Tatumella citrea]